ncbi:hypothetical protein P43SY_005095 [Pythium insidiosum]|uniref:Integrase catalytic domain-containing protein n=1 Tax=Pythium insidiosum TaxID=114742 RepID=A0AAD5LSR5_PYTIN|nr:hypothetical protein P43SY_005095 [Pythium insidiosum]
MNEKAQEMEDRVLEDMWYTPSAKVNLISLGYMQCRGYMMTFSRNSELAFLSKGDTKIKFTKVDGIYLLPSSKTDRRAWHKRFAPNDKTIKQMVEDEVIDGLNINTETFDAYECVPCDLAKSRTMQFGEKTHRPTRPLEVLCTDISPNTPTMEGYTMFLHVIDAFSRYQWVFLLVRKSQANQHTIALIRRLHVKFAHGEKWEVTQIFSDQGGEFINTELQAFCAREGIEIRTTDGYSPQENGMVERGNGVLITKVRSLLVMTRLPSVLWGESLLHVTNTVNVTATRVLDGRTPFEKFYGHKPNVEHLRTWGCVVFVHMMPLRQKPMRMAKNDPLSTIGLLLGYSDTATGYKYLDCVTGRTHTARGDNMNFTVESGNIERLLQNTYGDEEAPLPPEAPFARMRHDLDELARPPTHADKALQLEAPAIVAKKVDAPPQQSLLPTEAPSDGRASPRSPTTAHLPAVSSTGRPRRKHESIYASEVKIPSSFKEAMSDQRVAMYWRAAMDEEMASLKQHGVWMLVSRKEATTRKAILTNKKVFAIKKDEHGVVKRFKGCIEVLADLVGSRTVVHVA